MNHYKKIKFLRVSCTVLSLVILFMTVSYVQTSKTSQQQSPSSLLLEQQINKIDTQTFKTNAKQQKMSQSQTIILFVHPWCRNCDKPTKIFQKLQQKYSHKQNLNLKSQSSALEVYISVQGHQQPKSIRSPNSTKSSSSQSAQSITIKKSKKQITLINQAKQTITKMYGISTVKNNMPFPSIFFQCKYYTGLYQGDLTFVQLAYWIKLNCFGIIDSCANENKKQKNSSLKSKHFINHQQSHQNQNDYVMKLDEQVYLKFSNTSVKNNQFSAQIQRIAKINQNIPFSHICLSKNKTEFGNSSLSKELVLKSEKQILENSPIFLTRFNHAIRRYLIGEHAYQSEYIKDMQKTKQNINSQGSIPENEESTTFYIQNNNPTAIFFLFNDASNPKLEQLLSIFMALNRRITKEKLLSHYYHDSAHLGLKSVKLEYLFKVINDGQSKSSASKKNQGQKFQPESVASSSLVQSIKLYFRKLANYEFLSKTAQRNQFVFIAACYNKDKSKCIYKEKIQEPKNQEGKQHSQKGQQRQPIEINFAGSKIKHLQKLFQFTNIKNPFEQQKRQLSIFKIFSAKFDPTSQTIHSQAFQKGPMGQLSNDFLLWLDSVYKLNQKSNQQNDNRHKDYMNQYKCQSNQIIQLYSNHNLTSIKESVQMERFVNKLNIELNQGKYTHLAHQLPTKNIKLQSYAIQQCHHPQHSSLIKLFDFSKSSNVYKCCMKHSQKLTTFSKDMVLTYIKQNLDIKNQEQTNQNVTPNHYADSKKKQQQL